jgi:hypothetical protein
MRVGIWIAFVAILAVFVMGISAEAASCKKKSLRKHTTRTRVVYQKVYVTKYVETPVYVQPLLVSNWQYRSSRSENDYRWRQPCNRQCSRDSDYGGCRSNGRDGYGRGSSVLIAIGGRGWDVAYREGRGRRGRWCR